MVWSHDGGKAWLERVLGSMRVALEQLTVKVSAKRQSPGHDAEVA